MVILFEYLVVGQWLGLQIISYVFKGIIQFKKSFFLTELKLSFWVSTYIIFILSCWEMDIYL